MSRDGFPRRFGDRHLVLKELGQGRIGRVSLAYGDGRLCAIKTLPRLDGGGGHDADDLGQFAEEASLLTFLQHPNLLSVIEAHPEERPPFFVTEYLRAKTLGQVLNRCAEWSLPFPLGLAVYVTRELLRGLAYLHEEIEGQVLVHRGVSPANVFCTYGGEVKLADFGFARWYDRLAPSLSGERWVPGAYTSPEHRLGLALDGRSDLYSVGLILWELLTGQRAVPPGATGGGVPHVSAPSEVVPDLPREIDDVVMMALAEDPADRYPNASAFASRLAMLLKPGEDASTLKLFLADLFGAEQKAEAEEERRSLTAAMDLEPGAAEGSRPSGPGGELAAPVPVPVAPAATLPWNPGGPPLSGQPLIAAPGVSSSFEMARVSAGPWEESGSPSVPTWHPGMSATMGPPAPPAQSNATIEFLARAITRSAASATPDGRPRMPRGPVALLLVGIVVVAWAGRNPSAEEPQDAAQAATSKKLHPIVVPMPSRPGSKAAAGAPSGVSAAASPGPSVESLRPIKLGKMSVPARLRLTEALYRKGRFSEALAHGKAALAAGGKKRARLLLAKIHIKLEDYPSALAQYESVLKGHPKSREAKRGRARMKKRLQQASSALHADSGQAAPPR